MTFDGPNKLLILSSVTLDLIAAWSAYKGWLLAGNAGYALAFDTVGGEPINPVSGTLVPLFLFQKNGWKVRPMEANHTLEVINGMLIGEGGGDPFVPTLGSYNVKVKLIPNDKGDNEKAPDFRLQAASHDIGAAWKKTSEAGREYISVTLDDPSFPATVYARLIEGEDGTHDLIWSRSKPQAA